MDKKTVVGQLLIDDTISQEEAKVLLSHEMDDFEHEGERVNIVSELLFGRLINPEEATVLLDPLNSDSHFAPNLDDFFDENYKSTDLIEFDGKLLTVRYSFKPIQYLKQELEDG